LHVYEVAQFTLPQAACACIDQLSGFDGQFDVEALLSSLMPAKLFLGSQVSYMYAPLSFG